MRTRLPRCASVDSNPNRIELNSLRLFSSLHQPEPVAVGGSKWSKTEARLVLPHLHTVWTEKLVSTLASVANECFYC